MPLQKTSVNVKFNPYMYNLRLAEINSEIIRSWHFRSRLVESSVIIRFCMIIQKRIAVIINYQLFRGWFYMPFGFYCKIWKRRLRIRGQFYLNLCYLIFLFLSEFFDVAYTIAHSPLKFDVCTPASQLKDKWLPKEKKSHRPFTQTTVLMKKVRTNKVLIISSPH